jgi:hypothetical protein
MSEKSEALPIDQHPGVQGLAQIGRNAIDRVIELEQARARDNIAFKQLLAQRDALLEALKFVIRGVPDTWEGVQKARAAIKMVEEGK